MFYKFLRILANIALRAFYGKIEVTGLENVPKDGPMLIACNHPNGFLEPITMACLFPRPLHFMVRGDVFRKKWLKPILVNTNQIPIFRFRDGFSELRKNEKSLQAAYDALDHDAAIILFIEGSTESSKRLRPFQKGLARMAYDYIELNNFDKDINILPVGINYVSPFKFRSRSILNIGKPISGKSFFEKSNDKNVGVRAINKDLYATMKKMVLHVDDYEKHPILDKLLYLYEGLKERSFIPLVDEKQKFYPDMKKIADFVDSTSKDELVNIDGEIIRTSPKLDKIPKRKVDHPILNLLLVVILLGPALLGGAINLVPGLSAVLLAGKVLDEDNQVFRASIIVCSGVAIFFLYYLLLFVVAASFFGAFGMLIFIGLPLGFLFLYWLFALRNSIFKQGYSFSNRQLSRIDAIFTDNKIF